MKLLLTNDDGIDAPGLAALARAVAGLGEAVWIAPHAHLSGCGHRVTTNNPLRIDKRHHNRYALDGTPADCVRVGLAHLAPEVHWVLAGLNEGGNLGADVHHSGTCAAAREAALHGKPAIALSHYRKRGLELDWERAIGWMQPLLKELLDRPWSPGSFLNVNLPHLQAHESEPNVIICPLESGPLPLRFRVDGESLHYEGNYHARARKPGSDVDVCFGGDIAVTEVKIY